MNDPNANDSQDDMLEDIEAEYMALAAKGDRAAFDFALEFSDKVNQSAQGILMGMMTAVDVEPETTGMDDLVAAYLRCDKEAALALWARCARLALLNVLEKEVAPEWARTELARRHEANQEMQQEWVTS